MRAAVMIKASAMLSALLSASALQTDTVWGLNKLGGRQRAEEQYNT